MKALSSLLVAVMAVATTGGGHQETGKFPLRVESLEPWKSEVHLGDIPKRNVEEISTSPHGFLVIQDGTMDGENCRTPHGSWDPMVQTWESNRAVRMENIGDTDVVNPWLSNGRNNFCNIHPERAVLEPAGG